MKIIAHWIGGSPVSTTSDRLAPVWNPATGEQQAWVPLAGKAEVDAAVKSASPSVA